MRIVSSERLVPDGFADPMEARKQRLAVHGDGKPVEFACFADTATSVTCRHMKWSGGYVTNSWHRQTVKVWEKWDKVEIVPII